MQKSLRLLMAFTAFFLLVKAHAAVSPVSIAIIPPVQFPPSDYTVTGFRGSVLWGHHRNMYGLDVGVLGNFTDADFTGLAISGLFNRTMGNTTIIGLQAAGIANINTQKTRVYGVQIAAVNSNTADSALAGLQVGLANLSPHTNIYGVSVGLYNKANEVYGLQIGVVNVASSLHGLQIGLVNFHSKGLFAVSPLLNFGF